MVYHFPGRYMFFLFGISEEKPIFRQWRLRTCLTCWPLGWLPSKGNEPMKWRFIHPPQKRPNQQSILRMFSDVSQAQWSHPFPFSISFGSQGQSFHKASGTEVQGAATAGIELARNWTK
jgi:hypothetical protein